MKIDKASSIAAEFSTTLRNCDYFNPFSIIILFIRKSAAFCD